MTLRSNDGTSTEQQNTPQSFNHFTSKTGSQVAEAIVHYPEEAPRQTTRSRSNSYQIPYSNGAFVVREKARTADAGKRRSPPQMNGLLGNAPQPVVYVRALYDYEADDRTSLSFHEGDVIQVITQLESGWWDGVINEVRGWFPSNYCQVIPTPEDTTERLHDSTNGDMKRGGLEEMEEEDEESEEYVEEYDEEEGESEGESLSHLPLEGTNSQERSGADFWIPQATPDGRLFYFNTETGESSMELPLESPSSTTENGPRNRMNVNIPDKTRPPPEMMARGYIQDEDDESDGNSASELEGESLMMAARSSYLVCVSQLSYLPHTD